MKRGKGTVLKTRTETNFITHHDINDSKKNGGDSGNVISNAREALEMSFSVSSKGPAKTLSAAMLYAKRHWEKPVPEQIFALGEFLYADAIAKQDKNVKFTSALIMEWAKQKGAKIFTAQQRYVCSCVCVDHVCWVFVTINFDVLCLLILVCMHDVYMYVLWCVVCGVCGVLGLWEMRTWRAG